MKRASGKKTSSKTVRCSISFPAEQYVELERIAKRKKVSLAWVVREAMEHYLAEQWPLLSAGSQSAQQGKAS